MEEVFDRRTLLAIYDLMNSHHIGEMGGVISAGKESRVYYATAGDGSELAVKIYLTTSAEFRRNRLQYVAGDPRFKRVPADFRRFTYLWARREYANLEEAHRHRIPVPKPKFCRENILGMSFLGEKGLRYPLLEETQLEPSDYGDLHISILDMVGRLYRDAGMVHGDLSQFNIVIGPRLEPYLIDLAQAVSRTHPAAERLLEHGVAVLVEFFRKRGVNGLDIGEDLAVIRGG
ncbi:MAG: RIO1 family regulatory kinase/ATPase [Nitrososphaerota archaeon]